MNLHLDFETRSTVDLKACGADVYARHPSTEVMAVGWAFDEGKVNVIRMGDRPHADISKHISNGGYLFGHNCPFEWLVWNYTWRRQFPELPELKIEQCFCTMAMAYAMGLPGALEKAAPAAGITQEKDMKGGRVMLQLSQPREEVYDLDTGKREIKWWDPIEHKDKYDRMYSYCAQDVEVERQLHKRLLPLSASERELWLLDHRINQRGVRVDHASALQAVDIVAIENQRLNEEMRRVTNNEVATYSANAQLTAWIRSRGVELDGVAKSDVTDLLEKETLPEDVSLALQIRRDANKSSTAKFNSLIQRSDPTDRRMRSTLQYHGAGTGRWAARGFQLHNLPRSRMPQNEIEQIFNILRQE
jgi:DNA polymerase